MIYIYLLHRYFTDVFNLLQPIYIFIIFVLKKNVINIMLGRDKKKITTTKTRTRKTGATSKNTTTGMLSIRSETGDKIEMTPIIKN